MSTSPVHVESPRRTGQNRRTPQHCELHSRGADDATLLPRKPCGRRGPGLTPPLAAYRILLLVGRVLLQPMLQVRAVPV